MKRASLLVALLVTGACAATFDAVADSPAREGKPKGNAYVAQPRFAEGVFPVLPERKSRPSWQGSWRRAKV